MTFTWGQFHESSSTKISLEITYQKFHSNLPGINELNTWDNISVDHNLLEVFEDNHEIPSNQFWGEFIDLNQVSVGWKWNTHRHHYQCMFSETSLKKSTWRVVLHKRWSAAKGKINKFMKTMLSQWGILFSGFDCDFSSSIVNWAINSLAPGRFQFNIRKVIFKRTLVNGGWGISYEIALRWMSQDLTDDKSTLVQVMAWSRQATSHYLSQCWPRSMSLYGVTRPQWVKFLMIFLTVQDSKFLVPCDFWICGYSLFITYHKISDISRTKSQNLKRFSSRLAAVLAQSIEARCYVENEDVVGAAPTGNAPTTSEWSTFL